MNPFFDIMNGLGIRCNESYAKDLFYAQGMGFTLLGIKCMLEHYGVKVQAVRAEKHLYSGERSIEAYHGAGSLFGDVLMSARNAASPVDVIACEDTEVLFVSIDKIMHSCPESCAAHERLRMNLLNELSEKFWTLRKKLNYLRIKSMRGRIATYLLELFSQSGAVTVKCLPRDDTAALLGVNRSALSREIGRMRSDGLIDVDGKLVTLLDIEALKRCTMN